MEHTVAHDEKPKLLQSDEQNASPSARLQEAQTQESQSYFEDLKYSVNLR